MALQQEIDPITGLPITVNPTMGFQSPASATAAPPGLLSKISSAFGGPQGLLTLGANLMSAGGPSPTRVSIGQALGPALLANQEQQRAALSEALKAQLMKSQVAKNLRGDQTNAQRDYEYAKANGFKGTFEQWKQIAMSESAGPASIQEYNLYAQQEKAAGRPPEEFMPWLKKRSAYSVGAPFTQGQMAGAQGAFSRVTGGFTPETTLPEEAAAAATLASAEASGKTTGTGDAQRALDRPSAQARLDAASQKIDLFIKKAGDIVADPSLSRATGLMAYIPSVYGGGAKNAENAIEALKGQLGFNELQDMRANSPTGGALGNVTERELSFLQNSLLSLERSQSPDQYRANLLDLIEYANGMRARLRRAFEQTYASQGASAKPQKRVRVDAQGNVIQ
jgi:hypothetical protein